MSAIPSREETELAPNGWPRWLLAGFRAGDTRALTEVYREHAPQVARHLRFGFSFESAGRAHRFVGYGGGFELHDALHETFRRAFEPRARMAYDGLRPFGPYLNMIARNVVLRGFRAQRRRFVELDETRAPAAEDASVGAASPEVWMGRAQVQGLVQEFLQGLAADERRLLHVRFIDGTSQRDAAEILGLGRQQIRSREAKLRGRLVAYLRRHGEGEGGALSLVALALLTHAAVWADTMREGLSR
jgi:RNA polymerase sigma-70 factor (ECF subfamily)